MPTLLDRAAWLARRGVPVFPCRAEDKRPVPRAGFKAATADPEDVAGWCWDETRLIGVPTGPASGIAVLDVDPRHGGDAWLSANGGRLPRTRLHETRSGGEHLLFRWTDGLRNSAGLIAPGIDVRADGGYVVIWWPAHGLRVANHLPLGNLPPWPSWLVPARPVASARRVERVPPGGDPPGVSRLANFVRESRNGERNNRLFWAACRVAEMRFEREGHRGCAADRLFAAAVEAGLDADEARKTIESALSTNSRT